MKSLYFVPVCAAVIAALVFIVYKFYKVKLANQKKRRKLLKIGVVFCILSIIASLVSFYLFPDRVEILYPVVIPLLLILVAAENFRRIKRGGL